MKLDWLLNSLCRAKSSNIRHTDPLSGKSISDWWNSLTTAKHFGSCFRVMRVVIGASSTCVVEQAYIFLSDYKTTTAILIRKVECITELFSFPTPHSLFLSVSLFEISLTGTWLYIHVCKYVFLCIHTHTYIYMWINVDVYRFLNMSTHSYRFNSSLPPPPPNHLSSNEYKNVTNEQMKLNKIYFARVFP